MPTNLKFVKESSQKLHLWHLAARLTFQNYNKLMEQGGMLVKCSDRKVRDCVFVLVEWLGDQPEVDCMNCMVQVSF